MTHPLSDVDVQPYDSPVDHLLHHLERVRLWLKRYLLLYPERQTTSEGDPSHLYVSQVEMTRFLERMAPEKQHELAQVEAALAQTRQLVQLRVERSSFAGVLLPLEELRAAFGLSDDAVNLLVGALAPDFEPAFARAYTHAWCDFTQKRTTGGFLLELLGVTPVERERIRTELDVGSPLVRYQILELKPPQAWGSESPVLHAFVSVCPRIADYLRGITEPRIEDFHQFAVLKKPKREMDQVMLPDETKSALHHLMSSAFRQKGRPLRVFLYGPRGCGKKSLAEALAHETSRSLVVADIAKAPLNERALYLQLVALMREAQLQGAELYFDHGEAWLDAEQNRAFIRILAACLEWYPATVYLSADQTLAWLPSHLPDFVSVQVPYPSTDIQRLLWHRYLPPDVPLASGVLITDVVKRYSMSGGNIRESIKAVLSRLRLRAKRDQVIYRDELYGAVRNNLRHQLGDLAIPVSNAYDWSDLILPKKVVEKLEGILGYFKYQNKIMREWGFGGKLIYGKGLSALFSGPSGTGKTMAAAIIARELGMEIFQIDLSRVVNKYIGETEKNMGKIFNEAGRAQAVLLFDEADSLFAKRTEVKSSTDRYANLEVNYLLQRMEQFDGITILTTNLESALDEAFVRRIRFRVAFPFPDAFERARLWASMIPEEAPTTGNLDLEWLGKDYDMAGGNIKKTIIRAAIIAAGRDQAISYEVLKEAADKEYAEMGKVVRHLTGDD